MLVTWFVELTAAPVFVDDVVDAAGAGEEDGHEVVEFHSGRVGDIEGALSVDGHALVEEGVDAEAPAFVCLDGVGDFVGGEAVDAVVAPVGLARS